MPRLWYGDDHVGAFTQRLANTWISVTTNRPVARLAQNGKRPFIIKKVAFKCAAAPNLGQKMHGRASTADGSVYDDSYIGNTISWQSEAKVTYEFQAINLHFADDGGAKIRAWLVSGGPFLWASSFGGGTTETPNGSYNGLPVGYFEYAEVALAPTGFKVARDTADLNHVTFTWDEWDVAKASKDPTIFDAIGSTYAVSGYCVEIARDPTFTTSRRLLYVSKGKGEAYGLYYGYDWYFRISTRNEVSEHYKLPGGQMTVPYKLPLTAYTPPDATVGEGLPDGATPAGANTDVGSNGDAVDANNPNSTSNQGSSDDVATGTDAVDKNAAKVLARAAQMNQTLIKLQTSLDAASAEPTETAWTAVLNLASALKSDCNYIIARTTGDTQASWTSVLADVTAAQTAATAAKNTAKAAQSTAQKLNAVSQQVATSTASAVSQLADLDQAPSSIKFGSLSALLADLLRQANAAYALTTGALAGSWSAAALDVTAAKAASDAAVTNITAARAAAVAAATQKAVASAASAKAASASAAADPSYDGARAAASTALTSVTNAAANVKASGPSVSGSSKVVDASGNAVYTPIPDTTAQRTSSGGLLISSDARATPGHTVYLMDRGGRQRLGQFFQPTSIGYNRIRDDQSAASVVLSGKAIARNKATLDALAVGRHEIAIFRGTKRVWEGPITLLSYKKDSIELRALDITHYLNRTVMKGAYSNAYPNLDYCVSRIAGIIVRELGVKESLDPPVNILPFLHAYVQEGDARTTRTTLAAEATVWGHLDDLAAKAGIDYTVIGRSLHIWDTSRPALGRVRTVTEQDFVGELTVTVYGMETATQTFVSDGQGNYGRAGGTDDFYGEIDLLSTAYDENGNAVDSTDNDPTNDTVPIAEMDDQATRNLKGRNPTPLALRVPDNSSFRLDRGIGLDVLIPGVYIPVVANLAGQSLAQMMKLKEVAVLQNESGETVTLTMTPASDTDEEATLTE